MGYLPCTDALKLLKCPQDQAQGPGFGPQLLQAAPRPIACLVRDFSLKLHQIVLEISSGLTYNP